MVKSKKILGNPNDFQLNDKQIMELIKLADFTAKDIFFDLGSGMGGVVSGVAKNTKVKKSIGIEKNSWYYEEARKYILKKFRKSKDLERVDILKGSYYNEDKNEQGYVFNLEDATVVFASIVEGEEDVEFYKERLNWNKVRIVKKDIPLVGYSSIPNRTNDDCWFFLMKPPYKRIRGLKNWIKSVSKNFETTDDLYSYYFGQWYRRCRILGETEKESKNEATSHLLNLERLIVEKF